MTAKTIKAEVISRHASGHGGFFQISMSRFPICHCIRGYETRSIMRVFAYGIVSVLSVATSFGVTAELGRIVIPAPSSIPTASTGLQKLSGRNGLLYVPMSHSQALPLLIMLHKSGGSAREW